MFICTLVCKHGLFSVLMYVHVIYALEWCVKTWATLCAGVCTCVFICALVWYASMGTCDVGYLHVHVLLFFHFRTVLIFLSSLQTLKILDSRKSLFLAVERESSSQFSSSSSCCCPWVAAGQPLLPLPCRLSSGVWQLS